MQHLHGMPVAYIVAMMTTDELIDLNESGTSPDTSVLRMREVTQSDLVRTFRTAVLIGFGFIISAVFFFGLHAILSDTINELLESTSITLGIPIFAGVLILLGVVIPFNRLRREAREGYLRIDNDKIEYWTPGSVRVIPMERVFAAGQTKSFWGFNVLRIYFLEANVRWFASAEKSFKNYEAVAGPAMKVAYGIENGHEIARNAIIWHYNNRVKKGLGVATLPAYQFKSIQTRREKIITGEMIEIAKFECDGSKIIYATTKDRFEIPVHAVKDIKIHKVQSKYGVTEWTVTLDLDISSGYEKVVVNIRDIPQAQEIENYLRCLPLLFPVPKDDGYWI